MSTLPKKYITDNSGNRVLPISHTSAIFDDNGTSVETLLSTLQYTNIGYNVYASSGSGTVTINYDNGPIQVITLSGDVSSVNVSNVPAGHSCHVIFVSNSASYTRSIAIAHNSSTRCCPEGQDLSLTVPEQGNGYTEVDFLNANNIIYVRGV